MSLILTALSGDNAVTSAVEVPSGIDFDRTGSGFVYSGAKFDGDGNLYAMTATGAWQQVGTWLSVGAATAYHLTRTIIDGTLSTDAGAGPLQMNTDREYYIKHVTFKSTQVFFEISDDGGTTTVASGTYDFETDSLV